MRCNRGEEMRSWNVIIAIVLQASATELAAHTIPLGEERAPRACAVIREGRETNLLFFRHQKQELYYVDGVRQVQVVVLPTKPLDNSQADTILTDCAKTSFYSADKRSASVETTPEDIFIRAVNQCLHTRRTGYEISGAFFRRSDVTCPPSTRPSPDSQ